MPSFNSSLKLLIILALLILVILIGFIKIKFNIIIINICIIIIIILIVIVIIIDILGIVIVNKKNKDIQLQNKLNNISILIYNHIEICNYGINEDIENQLSLISNNLMNIKEDIKRIYNIYYKYYFYSNIIDDIINKLLLKKKNSLIKYIINEIKIHKTISTKKDLQIFIKLKINGLKTDLKIYKKHIKNFFKSLYIKEDLKSILIY